MIYGSTLLQLRELKCSKVMPYIGKFIPFILFMRLVKDYFDCKQIGILHVNSMIYHLHVLA